jgi:hypothetical protein
MNQMSLFALRDDTQSQDLKFMGGITKSVGLNISTVLRSAVSIHCEPPRVNSIINSLHYYHHGSHVFVPISISQLPFAVSI